jgi:hypothetical protein
VFLAINAEERYDKNHNLPPSFIGIESKLHDKDIPALEIDEEIPMIRINESLNSS